MDERSVSLFNKLDYHRLNAPVGARPAILPVGDDAGAGIGSLSGVVVDSVFRGGYSAPFGGFDVVQRAETITNLSTLVDGALAQARETGARSVELKLPPPTFDDNQGALQFLLLNRGFVIDRADLNQSLLLDQWESADAYRSALRPAARKSLKYLETVGLEFEEVHDDASFAEAYDLLAHNRERNGRSLSITRDYVLAIRSRFGARVRMYRVRHAGDSVAAALVYEVRPDYRFVVAWGDAEHTLRRSPMLWLACRLVDLCFDEGVTRLDLGTSTDPAISVPGSVIPNSGLFQFKRSLLASAEPRLTVRLDSLGASRG